MQQKPRQQISEHLHEYKGEGMKLTFGTNGAISHFLSNKTMGKGKKYYFGIIP